MHQHSVGSALSNVSRRVGSSSSFSLIPSIITPEAGDGGVKSELVQLLCTRKSPSSSLPSNTNAIFTFKHNIKNIQPQGAKIQSTVVPKLQHQSPQQHFVIKPQQQQQFSPTIPITVIEKSERGSSASPGVAQNGAGSSYPEIKLEQSGGFSQSNQFCSMSRASGGGGSISMSPNMIFSAQDNSQLEGQCVMTTNQHKSGQNNQSSQLFSVPVNQFALNVNKQNQSGMDFGANQIQFPAAKSEPQTFSLQSCSDLDFTFNNSNGANVVMTNAGVPVNIGSSGGDRFPGNDTGGNAVNAMTNSRCSSRESNGLFMDEPFEFDLANYT